MMLPCIFLNSIDAFGVDIAYFSAMPDEQEVLLLSCLPLTNGPGDNPEADLWTFNVKSPEVSDSSDLPPVMIDYVHPGKCMRMRALLLNQTNVIRRTHIHTNILVCMSTEFINITRVLV